LETQNLNQTCLSRVTSPACTSLTEPSEAAPAKRVSLEAASRAGEFIARRDSQRHRLRERKDSGLTIPQESITVSAKAAPTSIDLLRGRTIDR